MKVWIIEGDAFTTKVFATKDAGKKWLSQQDFIPRKNDPQYYDHYEEDIHGDVTQDSAVLYEREVQE